MIRYPHRRDSVSIGFRTAVVDQFRLKYTIGLVSVAIDAVDSARQATQRAVQQQRIEETMLAKVIAKVIAKNQETGLLELYLKDTDTSK